MRPTRTALAALALSGALLLHAGAAAGATAYQRVLKAYERAGTIPACEFSSSELESALGGVDTYGAQYFADFTQAVQNALSARAGGACAARAATPRGSARAVSSASGPGVGIPANMSSVTRASDADVPAPLWVLAGLALIGLLGGAIGVLRRRLSRER